MKRDIHIRNWLILSGICFLFSWISYQTFYISNEKQEVRRFQKDFYSLEKKQEQKLEDLLRYIEKEGIEKLWRAEDFNSQAEFFINIYERDSLVFWNSNQIDLKNQSRTKNHYIYQFPNGYYLVDHYQKEDYTLYIGSTLQEDYYYKNQSLTKQLSPHFRTSNPITISVNLGEGKNPIISHRDATTPLFYISLAEHKESTAYQQLLIFGFFTIGVLGLLMSLSFFLLKLAKIQSLIYIFYPLLLMGIRFISIDQEWEQIFSNFRLFEPSLYASSTFLPSLGSLILSIVFLTVIIWWIISVLSRIREKQKISKGLLLLLYLATLSFLYGISLLFDSLLLNSSILLDVEKVLSLSLYSIIALLLISVLFLQFYFLTAVITQQIQEKFDAKQAFLVWGIASTLFLIFTFFYEAILCGILAFIVTGIIFRIQAKRWFLNSIKYNLLFIVVFSIYSAVVINQHNLENEYEMMELYANQLITDQDPSMEVEYENVITQLVNNSEFYQLLNSYPYFSTSEFNFQLENCCFNHFGERFDIQFLLFNKEGKTLLHPEGHAFHKENEVQEAIDVHTIPSNISEGLFYVKDYFQQLSYIGYQNIQANDSLNVDFYLLFKSKKIPEKIGFPRLLMNERSMALNNIENYSIARYSLGKLVMQFGAYGYPLQIKRLAKLDNKHTSIVYYRDYEHFIYQQDDGLAVIISQPKKKFIAQLSSFSYLILFFSCVVLLLRTIQQRKTLFTLKSLSLAFRMQLVFLLIVVGSFLIYGKIAIHNVENQFNSNTEANLKEKMSAITDEIIHRTNDELESGENFHSSAFPNNLVKSIANTFDTDINFYDLNGELTASSQPKLYAKGISTSLMNSDAFNALKLRQRSEFIHYENYGKLKFLSGYLPLFDQSQELYGYLNVQHFSKQNLLKNQMNNFVITIINLTVLLLFITIIAVLLISRWITTPLRLIQQSLFNMELGVENTPIQYEGNDEIGTLVKDYNNKLKELELKAMQLARSERETAWREMAKQVAHEIKNPLTPMKLSVQQFQRSFDKDAPNAKEKIQRLVDSLIEQIDGLTKIANEFSNFAKMPKANEEELDLIPLLQNAKELYSSEDVDIKIESNNLEKIIIFADKDLMIRVFNNLIKNALQAQPEDQLLQIKIKVEEEDKNYLLCIEDNGSGIPTEIQAKIFTPNFTTKTTGSGLGLAMVKQIILTHNGEIWFETQEGKGTRFFIRLAKYSTK